VVALPQPARTLWPDRVWAVGPRTGVKGDAGMFEGSGRCGGAGVQDGSRHVIVTSIEPGPVAPPDGLTVADVIPCMRMPRR